MDKTDNQSQDEPYFHLFGITPGDNIQATKAATFGGDAGVNDSGDDQLGAQKLRKIKGGRKQRSAEDPDKNQLLNE